MFYGYIGGPVRTVFNDYKYVSKLSLIYPYSTFRKFYVEEKAWTWLQYQPHRRLEVPASIYRYGNIFKEHYASVEYLISRDKIVANINVKKLGNVKLHSEDPNILILNKTGRVEVEVKNLELNSDLIVSHLIAIITVLDLLGPYVDVEVILPNHSIFFTVTKYTGDKRQILRLVERISKRKGQVAWTLKDYVQKEDFDE